MPNSEIVTYKVNDYMISLSEVMQLPPRDMNTFDLSWDILSEKNITSEYCILRKVGSYELEWAQILTVSYEDDLVFVESEMPSIWGEGATLEEALKSYEDFLLYDFESYQNTPIENLDFFAQQELKLYKYLLKVA